MCYLWLIVCVPTAGLALTVWAYLESRVAHEAVCRLTDDKYSRRYSLDRVGRERRRVPCQAAILFAIVYYALAHQMPLDTPMSVARNGVLLFISAVLDRQSIADRLTARWTRRNVEADAGADR